MGWDTEHPYVIRDNDPERRREVAEGWATLGPRSNSMQWTTAVTQGPLVVW
jgi:hypothetical protein